MKTTVLFVATSLILVVAMVAVAIPNTTQAVKASTYCYDLSGGLSACFTNKADCKDARKIAAETDPDVSKCYKSTV